MKQVYQIDNNGYYTKPVIIAVNEDIPDDCIEIQPPNGLYRAKWNGLEWVEKGTPPDQQPRLKSQLEILQETVDMIVLDNLGVL